MRAAHRVALVTVASASLLLGRPRWPIRRPGKTERGCLHLPSHPRSRNADLRDN
jgi:hypothetical protein